MPHNKNIKSGPLEIDGINRRVMSFLNNDDSRRYISELRALAALNRTLMSSAGQLLAEIETDKLGTSKNLEIWLTRFLQFKRIEKHHVPLKIDILNRSWLPSNLRLDFIDYFLNRQNMSTAKSLEFLLFACNIAELLPKALPIFFRKLKSLGNTEECNFIFNHLMQLLDNSSIVHKRSAILTIAEIITELNDEQQTLVCAKFGEFINEITQEDVSNNSNQLLTKDILKVIPKIIGSMELAQQSDTIRTVINLFDSNTIEKSSFTLTLMLDIFDKMERQQQIDCINKVFNFIQQKSSAFTRIGGWIYRFWIPSVFDKMDNLLRAQIFDKIVRYYLGDIPNMKSVAINIIPNVFNKITLPQQLEFFDTLIPPTEQSDDQIFAEIAPLVLGDLDHAKKTQVFDKLMKALQRKFRFDKYEIITMSAKFFDIFDSTQKVQLFNQILKLLKHSDINVIRYTIEVMADIFDRLEDSQQIMVLDEIVKLFYVNPSNYPTHIVEHAIYAIEKIIGKMKIEKEPQKQNQLLIRITGLLDNENSFAREAAIRLLPKLFTELSKKQQIQAVNKILGLYDSDNNEQIKLQTALSIAEIFGRLGKDQQMAAFNSLLKRCAETFNRYPVKANLANAIAKIFNNLCPEQQMQAYGALRQLCLNDDNIDSRLNNINQEHAITAIAEVIDQIELDSVQQQQLLNLNLDMCHDFRCWGVVREGLSVMPRIFSKLQDDAQRIRAVEELLRGTAHAIDDYSRAIAITSLVEIYAQLMPAQKELVRTRITLLNSDSSRHVRETVLMLIPKIFNILEPEEQRIIFNSVMAVYRMNIPDDIQNNMAGSRAEIIKSPILYCHAYSDGSYSHIETELFPRTKLGEYCQEIEEALHTKSVENTNKQMKLSGKI
jgi:hypothetical protein